MDVESLFQNMNNQPPNVQFPLTCVIGRGAYLQAPEDQVDIVKHQLGESLSKLKFNEMPKLVLECGNESPDLLVRIERINTGNRFLRWLLPGLSPAEVQFYCEFRLPNGVVKNFNIVPSGNFGLFGGSTPSMLKGCAKKAVKEIQSQIPMLQ